MAAKLITERFALETGKVDRTGPYPVVRDVLLCGPVSANKRRYKAEAFAGDRVKRYDGRHVFLNHGRPNQPREYQERIAVVVNPRHRADGMPIGDLAVNPKHPYAEAFLHDAEHHPKSCGMSHVAQCETKRAADGWEDVTEMVDAESVDVVLGPATTKGLHEDKGRAVDKISLKQFAEAVGPKLGPETWGALNKLCREMGDDMAAAPVMDPPAEDAGPEDLKSGLMAALQPFLADAFDTGNSEKACAALRDFVKVHAKHTGGKTADTDGDGDTAGDTDGDGDGDAKESKAPTLAAVVAECKAAGLESPPVEFVADLMAVPGKDTRASLVKRFREAKANAAAEKPRSGSRPPGAAEAGAKPVAEDNKTARPLFERVRRA